MSVQQSNEKDFDDVVLKSDVPVLVDFAAVWCAPCRSLSKVLDSLSEDLGGAAKIVKVDIDESPLLAEKYNIRSLPTLIVFRDGKDAEQSVGLSTKDKLRKLLGF